METQEHNEHIGKTNQKGNQTFIKNIMPCSLTDLCFIENKRAVTGRRCIAAVREVIEGSWLTGLTHLHALQYSPHEMTRRTVADGNSDFKSRIPEISLSWFSSELHPCGWSSFRSTGPLAFIR